MRAFVAKLIHNLFEAYVVMEYSEYSEGLYPYLHRYKCQFFHGQVRFLGHLLVRFWQQLITQAQLTHYRHLHQLLKFKNIRYVKVSQVWNKHVWIILHFQDEDMKNYISSPFVLCK